MACSKREKIDLIVTNARIYTVDSCFAIAEAMAITNGKIVEVGTSKAICRKYYANSTVDAHEKYIYPGFIDAHCHFLGYGLNLTNAQLTGTKSWNNVVDQLVKHYQQYPTEWVQGRGWNQNDWETKQFPTNELLNEHFPETPVYITRIDGHAAIVNNAALRLANITASTKVNGGEIITSNGKPTGVLVDNAMELVRKLIPSPSAQNKQLALLNAQSNCLAVGLTGVHDAGLDTDEVMLIDSLQNSGQLKIRINAMLNPTQSNYEHFLKNGIYVTPRLSVRSVKIYSDGALGSRGALLLQPYSDSPNSKGIQVESAEYLSNVCQRAYDAGYQVCTHCIGDGGVRLMLGIYSQFLKGKNDLRWRIEHSQIVNNYDFELYGRFSIVPSIQTTHATSDMFWADERLGARIRNAYAYQQLLQQNGWLPNGSDFPIEQINPLLGYFAGVARKNSSGKPSEGFQMENALTREQALRSMTIWAAKSCFEENTKGSLETGKVADFVILDTDLLNDEIAKSLSAKVISTYINGECVYNAVNQQKK